MYWYNIYKKMLGIVLVHVIPQSRGCIGQIRSDPAEEISLEISERAASARNPRNENHTAVLILLLNRSMPNLDAHTWLRDAAADDADIRRYASTCSKIKPTRVNSTVEFRWKR